ncbi:uncharacterized protein Z518_03271 [Rhinocladiella mackenziei CBS 650.93]|uniref:Protamine P1 n=1 Tax=Rhinocladiella mackenziei CBS 650.93 TaxID=1442369 RepID=A0A0D2JGZ1_9EURO|nr:uncharacterized protein Z518_03271 [Rhinocladiella mackenziei CBS 650.93]KIX08615.1 hypothetical protein Z518_03271 [Rhinocladiella mackenziei CBS 650.93]
MPIVKSKVPDYPRPVSPVFADEIPICDDTIVYCDENDDVEKDEKQRAAKRRRIESYATSYLRGEQLFILTAQLKGPFGDGWQNPWAKRKEISDDIERVNSPRVCPESAGKPALQNVSESSKTSKQHEGRMSSYAGTPCKEQKLGPSMIKEDNRPATSPFWERQNVDRLYAVAQKSDSKNRRVGNWLKRGSSSKRPDHELPDSSPTPLKRNSQSQTKKWESPSINIQSPPAPDPVGAVTGPQLRRRSSTHALMPHEKFERENSSVVNLPRAENEGPTKAVQSSSLGAEGQQAILQATPANKQAKPPSTDVCRAECAILHVKCKSQQTDRPSATFLPRRDHDSDAEDQTNRPEPARLNPNPLPLADAGKPDLDHLSEVQPLSKSDSPSLHPVQEVSSSKQIESIVPPLSKEISDASLTNDFPSAQIVERSLVLSGLSNLSTGQMLREPSHHTTQDAAAMRTTEQPPAHETVEVDIPEINNEASNRHKAATGELPTPLEQEPCEPPEKTHVESERSFSPWMATKPRSAKTKKKACFVTDENPSGSSQGSITSVLRIKKPFGRKQDKFKNSNFSLSDGCGERAAPGPEPSSLSDQEIISKISRTTDPPRSILKSSLEASASSGNAVSSYHQDAQRPVKPIMDDDGDGQLDDDFDLDAAIDELGSFLGTWDAEREAAEIVKASG